MNWIGMISLYSPVVEENVRSWKITADSELPPPEIMCRDGVVIKDCSVDNDDIISNNETKPTHPDGTGKKGLFSMLFGKQKQK